MRAVNAWFGQRGWAPLGSAWHQYRLLLVTCALVGPGSFFLQAGELAAFVANRADPPMHIQVFARVACQGEAQAWLQAHIVALHLGNTHVMAQAGDAVFGERLANGIAFVTAGVVEALIVRGLVLKIRAQALCS